LEQVANQERLIPPELLSASDAFPSELFRAYAAPLVGRLPADDVVLLPAFART
jgi:hypothetical protein